jgi:hypothetical protein
MEASLRPQPVVFDSVELQPKPGGRVPVNSHSGKWPADENRRLIDSLTLTHRRDVFPIDS